MINKEMIDKILNVSASFEMLVEEDLVYDANRVELEEYNDYVKNLIVGGYKNMFEEIEKN